MIRCNARTRSEISRMAALIDGIRISRLQEMTTIRPRQIWVEVGSSFLETCFDFSLGISVGITYPYLGQKDELGLYN